MSCKYCPCIYSQLPCNLCYGEEKVINECKANHRSTNVSDMCCRAGCTEEETQYHLMNCQNILGEVSEIDTTFVKTEDLCSHRRSLQELLRRMDVVENWCAD